MNYARFLLRRLAFAALSAYLVVTATFALISFTPNVDLGAKIASAMRFQNASPAEIRQLRQRYLERRGLDESLLNQYVEWLVDVATLDWGYSFSFNRPVWDVLATRVPTTLEYVVPGVLLAVVFGVLFGLAAAMLRDTPVDAGVRVASYVLVGFPAYVALVFYTALSDATVVAVSGIPKVHAAMNPQILASVTVALTLLAGQVRFARTASLEQAGREFVKLVQAKGGSRVRVARHVLRNAAIPIVSTSVTEMLGVLMLTIYVVEDVLGIDGLAGASLTAVRERDLPLIIGTTMILVFIGIGGNLVQDVLYGYLDPRVAD
ncbi:MAG: ABC transporter permease [Halobacterium sp.]